MKTKNETFRQPTVIPPEWYDRLHFDINASGNEPPTLPGPPAEPDPTTPPVEPSGDPVEPPPGGDPVPKPPTPPGEPTEPNSLEGFPDYSHRLTREIRESYTDLIKENDNASDFIIALSKQGLTLPAEDATPEEVSEFFTKLGKPETAEGYTLPKAPAAMKNEEFNSNFEKVAHSANLTKNQADTMYNSWLDMTSDALKVETDRRAAAKETAQRELSTKHGDKLPAIMSNTAKAYKHFFGDKAEMLEMSDLGNDIEFIGKMAKYGELLREDGTLIRSQGFAQGKETDSSGNTIPPSLREKGAS